MPKIETAPAAQAGAETPSPKTPRVKKTKAETPPREVVYDEVQVQLCKGEEALDAEAFKELLGWEEETDAVKFGDTFDLRDHAGKKVRLTKNGGNRPWTESWSKQLAQDFLNRRWRLNGETVVVGRYAQTLSGQHRGIGLILASQMWADEGLPGNAYWRTLWPDGPPTMEGIVVFGVDESPETTRTIDNVKPRSLSDALYTGGAFANKKPADREKLSGMGENAIKILWDRTGEKANAFAPLRTHSEAIDFWDRHPSLKKCVSHIHEEDSEGNVGFWARPGTAAGLMYLMAAHEQDGDAYREEAPWAEKAFGAGFNKSLGYKQAEEFWTVLAGALETGDEQFKPVVEALARCKDYQTGCGGNAYERMALVIHAFTTFAKSDTLPDGWGLKYKTERDDDGNLILDDFPVLDGIDLGPNAADALADTTRADDPPDPKPEEIVAAAKAEYANGQKAGPDQETAEKFARDNPNVVLLWQAESTWNAYGTDANLVNEATHKEAKIGKLRSGLPVAKFPLDDDAANIPLIRIRAAKDYGVGANVATVILREGVWTVVPLATPKRPAAAPTEKAAHPDNREPSANGVHEPKPTPKAKPKAAPKLRGGT